MRKILYPLKNEEGFVLVTSMMMLVVLVIIGVAATNTTIIELQISGNDKAATQNFYEAESAAYEGGIAVKKFMKPFAKGGTQPYITKTASTRGKEDVAKINADQQTELNAGIRDPSTWTNGNSVETLADNTRARAMHLGISQGSSIALNSQGGPKHKFAVVGRYNNDAGGRRGNVMVEIGVCFPEPFLEP